MTNPITCDQVHQALVDSIELVNKTNTGAEELTKREALARQQGFEEGVLHEQQRVKELYTRKQP